MTRIGILTYHRSVNYGAVMQSLALALAIRERYSNAEVEIIDYSSFKMDMYYKLFTLYRGKDSIRYLGDRLVMYQAFSRGWRQLPLSRQRLSSDNVKRFNRWIGSRYDVVISGSDAVWNYAKRGLPNPYFLKDVPAIRMSYAASCNGLGISDFSEIEAKDREFLKEAFASFSYIGVRDKQTAAMVRSVLPEAEVHFNCDPSLLLGDLSGANRTAVRDRLCKYGFDPEKPAVGLMLSNHNGSFNRAFCEKLRDRYGRRFQTVALYSCNPAADIPYAAELTPQDWSVVFGLFDITITKYFHGALFSLLNRTPIMSVGAEKRIGSYPDKIEDMLDGMGLRELHFPASSASDVDWDCFFSRFDKLLACPILDTIDAGIKREQEKSESFFDALSELL